jgi:hypothetical protein
MEIRTLEELKAMSEDEFLKMSEAEQLDDFMEIATLKLEEFGRAIRELRELEATRGRQ